jgi:hypothetical protein
MNITYAQLLEFIQTLTPEQLAMPAMVYAGEVDDTMMVFATCFNTNEEMGASMQGISTDQPFMQI